MAKPPDPKEIVTTQELAISNMLEIEAMRQLLFEGNNNPRRVLS
jgi:hypothetical protein